MDPLLQFWIAPVWRASTRDHVGERPIRIAWAGPSGKRIHITGAPRSGTTLLLSLMLACFAIDGGVARERRLWRTPPKNRRIVCTKFPDETDFAAAMLACDSDLHVIFIVRDPRDVVVSRHHASPGRYLTNLRVWRQNYTAARPYFDHPRFHVVRYRDLVRDPDAVQRRLGAAMPFLEPVRPFSRYLECSRDEDGAWLQGMDMDLRPVCADSIANWRAHPGRVKGQIMRHGDIAAELIALGFEDNADWQGLLAGAIPDFSPGAAVEHAHIGKRITRAWRNTLGTIVYLARRHLRIELSETGEQEARRSGRYARSRILQPIRLSGWWPF